MWVCGSIDGRKRKKKKDDRRNCDLGGGPIVIRKRVLPPPLPEVRALRTREANGLRSRIGRIGRVRRFENRKRDIHTPPGTERLCSTCYTPPLSALYQTQVPIPCLSCILYAASRLLCRPPSLPYHSRGLCTYILVLPSSAFSLPFSSLSCLLACFPKFVHSTPSPGSTRSQKRPEYFATRVLCLSVCLPVCLLFSWISAAFDRPFAGHLGYFRCFFRFIPAISIIIGDGLERKFKESWIYIN